MTTTLLTPVSTLLIAFIVNNLVNLISIKAILVPTRLTLITNLKFVK